MITDIEIQGLRGIREGRLDGLAPLTVLTGPNSSGKSTVLDALRLVATPEASGAIGAVLHSREQPANLAEALFHWRARRLTLRANAGHHEVSLEHLHGRVDGRFRSGTQEASTVDGSGVRERALLLAPVTVVDADLPAPLPQLYAQAVKLGRKAWSREVLRSLRPEIEDMELLPDGLYFTLSGERGALPAASEGEGVQQLLRLVLTLAGAENGLALLEEPETHQHPAALWRTAQVLVAAAARDVQVVCTTHSLELVDAVVSAAGEAGLPAGSLALFRLQLTDGELRSTRWAGEELPEARTVLEADLR